MKPIPNDAALFLMKPVSSIWMAILCALLPLQMAHALDQETIESTVKIFCPTAAKDGKGGIDFDAWPIMPDGSALNLYDYGGSGTGFVINDQGYVMTNNHVVAVATFDSKGELTGFTEKPQPLIYVVQKMGPSYLVHKAVVDWQSANLDVAVIHCATLKAKPLPLSFQTPHESDRVISCGFPGVSNSISEDRVTQTAVMEKYIPLIAEMDIKKKESEIGRKLTDDEGKEILRNLWAHTKPIKIEWNLLLAAANSSLQSWKAEAAPLDISAKVNTKEVWKQFFAATVTEGNIEKVMAGQGFDEDRSGPPLPPIGLIQHNLDIRHGNSGGPLLNAEGDVIGVVGRAWSAYTMGDLEKQTLATRITETKKWLDDHHVAYLSPPWRLPQNFKVIVLVSLAFVLAMVACGLALVRRRATASSGYTTVIEDKVRRQLDAIMKAKEHPHPPYPAHAPAPQAAATPPRGAAWVLGGRDAQGRSIRLELTEALLTSRSDGVVIGRSAGHSQVVLNHDSISKQHAQLRRAGSAFLVSDRQSANGTAVNGRIGKPFEEMPLRVGDTLTLGEVKLQFTEA